MTQNPQGQPMNPTPQQPQRQGMSGCAKVGIGCAIVLMLGVIGTGVGIWWVASHAKDLATKLIASGINSAVDNAQMPTDQKAHIKTRVDQLQKDFVAGRVNADQLGQIVQNLTNGPIIPVGMVLFVDQVYVQPSPLPADEKTEGRKSLQRLARGVFEHKIDQQEINDVIVPISDPDPSQPERRRIKQHPTVEEMREFLKLAKEKADAAGVADEAWEVDLAKEVDKAIDDVTEPGSHGSEAQN